MKKLALILLAVVSMALVSCGGGSGNEVKLASPSITYEHSSLNSRVSLADCLSVKHLEVKETNTNEITVSGEIEIVQTPEYKIYRGYYGGDIQLLDEDGEVVLEEGFYLSDLKDGKKGDVGIVDVKIKTDEPASEIMKKAKYIRCAEMGGLKEGDGSW